MSSSLWRVGKEELHYIERAISGGLNGEFSKLFESRFARVIGAEYAIAVNSGTSALHVSLAALGIGDGDEVIVPPLTFIAPAFAPLFVGAVPVFADVDPQTFNIDPEEIKKKITHRSKAIICVSLYGLPVDMDSILKIARDNNLLVIADNAQCVVSRKEGQCAGPLGDVSIFSLQRSKHLTSGDGGVVVTDDANLALRIRKISDLGYSTLTAKSIVRENFKETIQRPDFKRHELVGFNFRMPEVCSAMGLAQLDKIDLLLERRQAIAKLYKAALKGCDWLVPQKTPEGLVNSYWAFALRLDEKRSPISWFEFRDQFQKNGGDKFYGAWSLSYLEPALQGMNFPEHDLYFEKGLCPVAESLQPQLIQLKTNYEDLSTAQSQADALYRTLKQSSPAIH